MKSLLIEYVGDKAIVCLEKAGRIDWLVCDDYDSTKPEGAKWSSAQFFESLADAVESALPSRTLFDVHIHGLYDGGFMSSHFIVEGRKNAVASLPVLLSPYRDYMDMDKLMKTLKVEDTAFFEDYGNSLNIDITPYKLGDELKY